MAEVISCGVTAEELETMSKADIRNIDPETLKEITEIDIDTSLPVEQRVAKFVEDVGNPYCYRYHGIAVKISFAGEKKLEDCIIASMRLQNNLSDVNRLNNVAGL